LRACAKRVFGLGRHLFRKAGKPWGNWARTVPWAIGLVAICAE